MNKFADTNQIKSPEALEDLRQLAKEHGINAELINSLKTSKTEARAHIRDFKRMVFLTNGALIIIGAALVIRGARQFSQGASALSAITLIGGAILFTKFFTVFLSMNHAIRETEAVARKHDLI